MVVATTRRARTGSPRRCAGSASCASRRSTRGSPRATSSAPGRQAEIVEVKGSVELAPLTGLAEGIVDLTATGTTLRENGLVVREEILASTARLIANPVAHKLKAAAIDDLVARMREALARWLSGSPSSRGRRRGRAPRARARARAGGGARGRGRDPRLGRGGRRRRAAHARAPLRRRATARSACPADELDAALDGARPRRARRAGARARERRARSRRPGWARTATSSCPQGQVVRAARAAGAPRRGLRARRPARRTRRSVVMGAVTARAAGVEEVVVAAPAHPVILAACALCGADEVYRMGGAQAIAALALRDGDDPARRRDRRARATSTCRRPSARSRGRVGIDGFAGPVRPARARLRGRRPAPDRARPARPGRARRGLARRRRLATTRAARRRRARDPGAVPRPGRPSRGGPKVLVDAPTWTPRSRSPRRSRPSTWSSWARTPRRSPRASRRAGCLFVGAGERDGVRRLRRGFEPHAADRRRGALRVRPHGRPLPPPHGRGARRRRGRRAGARRRADRRGRGLRRARRVDVRPDPRESLTR